MHFFIRGLSKFKLVEFTLLSLSTELCQWPNASRYISRSNCGLIWSRYKHLELAANYETAIASSHKWKIYIIAGVYLAIEPGNNLSNTSYFHQIVYGVFNTELQESS